MKKKNDYKLLFNNMKDFIQTQNKEIKKQCYSYVIKNSNSPPSFLINKLNIPKTTYYRYTSTVPTIKTRRNQSKRKKEMSEIIDTILPVASGRDYRILTTTKKQDLLSILEVISSANVEINSIITHSTTTYS